METIPADVMKRGETVISITLSRGRSGLSVTVKAHPQVEEFAQSFSSGEHTDVRTFGRYWTPLREADRLWVYSYYQPLLEANGKPDSRVSYTLNKPGGLLFEDEVANISFLRLVGVSEGAGVSFNVKGVYSLDLLRQIRDRVMEASKQFYVTYLKPVDLTVMVSTQEFNP